MENGHRDLLGCRASHHVSKPDLGAADQNWNFILNNIVFNAFVVALLTWVVMPLITGLCTVGYKPNKKVPSYEYINCSRSHPSQRTYHHA
jgi:hypothetical protein